jgi:hypothetical protein
MLEKLNETKMLKYNIKKGLSLFGQRIEEIGKQLRYGFEHVFAAKSCKSGSNRPC